MNNMHSAIPEEKLTEAYRLLLEMRENCAKHADDQYDDPKREAKCEALNIAMAAMGRSIPSRWIPVEERLPESDDNVLVIVNGECKTMTFEEAYMLASYYPGEGWIVEEYEDWENPVVTHWMPLPEPPKEVQK